MSDNCDQTPEGVTSGQQTVPILSEDNALDVELVADDTDEEFEEFWRAAQVIEVNGERHTIVSPALDPESGKLLLVVRSESGDQIALSAETLHAMAMKSREDNIQESVVSQSDETALTLASDMTSLTQSVSTSELSQMSSTSLAALPPIQMRTAATNVVQSMDAPIVSEEEYHSITTTPPFRPESDANSSADMYFN
ncbi:unnamed protein product [Medioppia subpectinata]|uniref:Uncharacterized protein n=1 Tax=Medioppia subpectinata TaxID=1979941 RepID=A0A7R9PYJ3_9ACAR|nr:unnamed protein product [Medioppia subpectinata]CAG2105472.1 unnamed protein product [Medioppia subpectinata]